MSNLVGVRRALLSVSDKRDLVPFARALVESGVEIVSTGGTARALADAGFRVIPVERLTGVPEMMDGRVKTLHPAVHGGLLARRDRAEHVRAMEAHRISPIDLLAVNLYPFERTLKEDLAEEQAIELIDIGGPAMIRSAAKNYEFVAVVTNPSQYDRIINEMRVNDGATTLALRRDLAAAAFSRTAEYDATISAWMCERQDESFPPQFRQSLVKREQLRYGENPHQQAALYANPVEAAANVVKAKLLHGKPLSYNNLNDAAAAFELAREMREAFPDRAGAVIVKHTNPCGVALAADGRAAFERAYAGDPLAAYGGILAANHVIDRDAAEAICRGEKFFEVIAATRFEGDAAGMLGERWANVRLLETGEIEAALHLSRMECRTIPGGMLVQQRDRAIPDPSKWQRVSGEPLDDESLETAVLLTLAAKHLKSNAVVIGAGSQMLGAGAGQMDRVTAARLAIEKARESLHRPNLIAASDGFFPFADGPQLLIDAGVSAIVQPGGSKRDAETVELCRARGVTMYLTGVRHFRH